MSLFKSLTSLVLFLSLMNCSSQDGVTGNIFERDPLEYGEISQTSIDYFNQSIGDTVLFTVNQSTLRDDAIDILNMQADWLKDNQTLPITIEGHADEQGTREYNLALGARRATAVRNYLVSQGVGEELLSIVTYGKERPLEVCSEEKCWAENRRAVTVVSGGLGN